MSFHPSALICTHSGKVIYESRKLATNAFVSFLRRKKNHSKTRGGGNHNGGSDKLEAYRCEHCGGFHAGHRNGKRKPKQTRRPQWTR